MSKWTLRIRHGVRFLGSDPWIACPFCGLTRDPSEWGDECPQCRVEIDAVEARHRIDLAAWAAEQQTTITKH
jgi:hypothetical protein